MDEYLDDIEIPKKLIYVVLPCSGEYMPEDDVEFVGIREDIMGADILSFKCPKCGKTHESYRLG